MLVVVAVQDEFGTLLCTGIMVMLVFQIFENVGMTMGIMPITGIPLPFVSYGGSALLPSLVALALLVGFARREPEAARALALRRRQRSSGVSARRARSRREP